MVRQVGFYECNCAILYKMLVRFFHSIAYNTVFSFQITVALKPFLCIIV
jgi:hypothetical protein